MSPQEVRSYVQSFAEHLCFSVAGSGENEWTHTEEPRREVRREEACVVCARKDWLEHRYKVRLFAAPPAPGVGTEEEREGDSEGHGTESEEDDVDPAGKENLQERSCKRLP